MTSLRNVALFCLAALALVAGCGGPSTGTDNDTGTGGRDTGMVGIDTGVPPADTGVRPIDTGVPPVDTGVPPIDTGVGPVDTGVGPIDTGVAAVDASMPPVDAGPITCGPGVECRNYPAALEAAARDATNLDSCVIQLHQSDCCGATDANGINHDARTELCAAERICDAMYPTPTSCTDDVITTDTGETTTVRNNVRLRIVDPTPCAFDPAVTCYTCETFVCTSDACRTAPTIAGGCG